MAIATIIKNLKRVMILQASQKFSLLVVCNFFETLFGFDHQTSVKTLNNIAFSVVYTVQCYILFTTNLITTNSYQLAAYFIFAGTNSSYKTHTQWIETGSKLENLKLENAKWNIQKQNQNSDLLLFLLYKILFLWSI